MVATYVGSVIHGTIGFCIQDLPWWLTRGIVRKDLWHGRQSWLSSDMKIRPRWIGCLSMVEADRSSVKIVWLDVWSPVSIGNIWGWLILGQALFKERSRQVALSQGFCSGLGWIKKLIQTLLAIRVNSDKRFRLSDHGCRVHLRRRMVSAKGSCVMIHDLALSSLTKFWIKFKLVLWSR